MNNTVNPYFSVIIPIYNAEKYLEQCLESIRKQTFTDIEVILVDDGSTDRSAIVCKHFCNMDHRFRYHKVSNGGPYKARAIGMELSGGRYFTFCDADDYYASRNVFSKFYDIISESETDISVLQFGFTKKFNHLRKTVRAVSIDTEVSDKRFYTEEYPLLLCSFWETSHLTGYVWNKLYSCRLKENMHSVNYRTKMAEDEILNLFLLSSLKDGTAFFSPYVGYVYRQGSGGTSKFQPDMMRYLDTLKNCQLSLLEKRTIDDKEKIRRILFGEMAGWFSLYVREAAHNLDKEQLIEMIRQTLAYPSFRKASEYYKLHPEYQSREVSMLRKADWRQYYDFSQKNDDKPTLLDKVKKTLIQVYKTI